MEFVLAYRALARRKLLVAVGFVLSIAVVLALGKSPQASSASAWTRILADSSKSQLAYPAPLGFETTGWRARLAIDLMQRSAVTQRIAREAGVPHDQLLVLDPFLATPTEPASLPRHASLAAISATAGAPYQVFLSLDTLFPIVLIEASAPDRAHATRLVEVATKVLRENDSTVENKNLQGLSFDPIGPTKSKIISSGGGRATALMAAFAMFAVWCIVLSFVTLLLDQVRERRPRASQVGRRCRR